MRNARPSKGGGSRFEPILQNKEELLKAAREAPGAVRRHRHTVGEDPRPAPHPHQPRRAAWPQGLGGPGVSHTCSRDELLLRLARHRPTGNPSRQGPCSEQGESRGGGTTLLMPKARALFESVPPHLSEEPPPNRQFCSWELTPGRAMRLCHHRGDNLQLTSLPRNNSEHFFCCLNMSLTAMGRCSSC